MGRKIDQDDIQGIARTVEEWLRSEQARRYLHGLLFKLYGDFVSADGDIPGIPRAVITDFLLSERTKEIETLNREKNPTEEDIKRKQELQSEVQGIQELKRQQDDTCAVAHKAARAKALIPDLIVETIEQKAAVVLAYYYHYRDPDNLSADSGARKQLLEEWPKFKVPDSSPNDEERPVPIAIGFQFFVDECSEVPNISPKGHQRVEKWATEVAEACADATLGRESPGPKTDTKDLASDQQIYDEYQEMRGMEKDITRAEFARSVDMTEKEFKRLYDRVHKRQNSK